MCNWSIDSSLELVCTSERWACNSLLFQRVSNLYRNIVEESRERQLTNEREEIDRFEFIPTTWKDQRHYKRL